MKNCQQTNSFKESNQNDRLSLTQDASSKEHAFMLALADELKLTSCPFELTKRCLEQFHQMVSASGSAIWISLDEDNSAFMKQGELPIDEVELARLVSFYDDNHWDDAIIHNNLQNQVLGHNFPGLHSILLAPVAVKQHRFGWILCCHLEADKKFHASDAKFARAVSSIIATHLCNTVLRKRNDEMLLAFVKTLVSTIDAKDAYTRGHSERVALVARRLGQELGLSEDDLYDLYLAGLLHDIGKIGIDERILRKPGELTEAEYREVQKHPLLGFTIIKDLENLRHLLPGIRSHHESIDGSGYPDQLVGDESPLMARILAVADAFDAMGSDRPFRKGMPLKRIESVFEERRGIQWDADIIDAYFHARDDIILICRNYSRNDVNLLRRQASSPHFDLGECQQLQRKPSS